jgi:hypothetical protein
VDGGGAGPDLATPTSPTQGGHQLGMRQPPAQLGGRGQAEHGHRVPTPRIAAEGGHRSRIEGPQGAADQIRLPLAGPDQLLVPAGQHLDRLGQPRVTPHRPMMMPIGADQIGQHPRIAAVRLGS